MQVQENVQQHSMTYVRKCKRTDRSVAWCVCVCASARELTVKNVISPPHLLFDSLTFRVVIFHFAFQPKHQVFLTQPPPPHPVDTHMQNVTTVASLSETRHQKEVCWDSAQMLRCRSKSRSKQCRKSTPAHQLDRMARTSLPSRKALFDRGQPPKIAHEMWCLTLLKCGKFGEVSGLEDQRCQRFVGPASDYKRF